MNDSSSPQPLSLTVHSVDAPDLANEAGQAMAESRRTRSGRLRMLLVLAVCAAPVVASYLAYYVLQPQGRANHGVLIDPPRPWPRALEVTRLDGTAVAPAALAGQWLLVVVGSAACDAACERRLLVQRQLREMLGRERDRVDKLWLVRDEAPLRPDLLRALEAAPATSVMRVAPAPAVTPAAADVLARWLEPAAGRTLEDHLFLIDPRGQWIMRWPADAEPARIKRDLDRLLRASASWDRPGR